MNSSDFQALYLKQQIVQVKNKLGRECTFLAFETVKDRLFFKAKIGKDRVRVQVGCELNEIGQEQFEDLYNILNEKRYVSEDTL